MRLEALYDRHAHMVRGLCRLLLRDVAEAEDAAQQVFLSAYRALLGGTEPSEPAAWIATIARNECRTRVRRRMRAPLPSPEDRFELPDPFDEAIRRFDLRAVWFAISELPARQREAFLLRELGGLSYDELALALGVSSPAVESLLVRARARLRSVLASLGSLVPALERVISPSLAAKTATATVSLGLVAGGTIALPRGEGGPARSDADAAPRVARAPVRHVAARPVVRHRAPVAPVVFAAHSAAPPRTVATRTAEPVLRTHESERSDRASEQGREPPQRAPSESETEHVSAATPSERDSAPRSEPATQERDTHQLEADAPEDGDSHDSSESDEESG